MKASSRFRATVGVDAALTRMELRASRVITVVALVCAVAALPSLVSPRTASAVPRAPKGCTDPLARSAAARACIHYDAGYARWQNSMQVPNNTFEVVSDEGLDVIMFDNWVIITGPGNNRRLVSRDRFVYSAEEKFASHD